MESPLLESWNKFLKPITEVDEQSLSNSALTPGSVAKRRELMSELYQMKIHEIKHLTGTESYEVICVPGGWIYTRFIENGTGGYDMSSCFVPRDDDYTGHIKKRSSF